MISILGKSYLVRIEAQAMQAAAHTFLEVVAGSTKLLGLVELSVSQAISTASAFAKVEAQRKSAAATGGVSFTPLPLVPNQGASSFTAKIEGGTTFSAEGTVTDQLDVESFNVLSGLRWTPTPSGVLWVPPSGILALKWASTPPAAVTAWDVTAKFVEVG